MHERPDGVSDDEVLAAVLEHWLPDADAVEHLPVGFGAHHWAASAAGERRLFVTLDALAPRRTREELEGAYAGAVELAAQGLEFVLPCVAGRRGGLTVPFGPGALSATRWHDGTSGDGPHPDAQDAAASARRLARLHAASVGPGVPRWAPLVPPTLGADLAALTVRRWDGGPFGAAARAAVTDALVRVAGWTARYHHLAGATDPATWVPTHGEPHTRNLLRTPDGDLLVDWESLKLAPRERDLSTLLAGAHPWVDDYRWPDGATGPDPELVELFDLEWRLDEIAQYSAYFAAEHTDDQDSRTALGGLRHELGRP